MDFLLKGKGLNSLSHVFFDFSGCRPSLKPVTIWKVASMQAMGITMPAAENTNGGTFLLVIYQAIKRKPLTLSSSWQTELWKGQK